jgi:uncharacterized protein YndB with AHSA1/START domain
MIDGTLQTDGPRPAVRFERHLRQPPDVVWRALTEPAELKAWFPTDIITDRWEVGATLEFPFRNDEGPTMTGTVLECDEPRRLAYTWGDDVLRFELAADGEGGTRLVFIDEVDANVAARNAAGWDICLDALAGQAPPEPGWKPRFDGYVAAFEPVLGAQEGPPPAFDDAAH